MRLNLYVACCSALVYFSNAIQLQPEGVPAADEMATDFAEIYQNEYVTDLAETYAEKADAKATVAKAKAEAAKVKAEAKLTKATDKAAGKADAK